MDTKAALTELLNGYFGYQPLADGIADLAQVGRNAPDYHRQVVATLRAGIAAAQQGEPWVLACVRSSWVALPGTLAEAQEILETILSEYQAQVAASDG